MKSVLVLLLTLGILALQYHLGLTKKLVWGLVLPVAVTALFLAISIWSKTVGDLGAGILCSLALVAVWGIGRARADRYAKAQLDKMKTKDLP